MNAIYTAVAWPFVSFVFLFGRIADPIVCWWANLTNEDPEDTP